MDSEMKAELVIPEDEDGNPLPLSKILIAKFEHGHLKKESSNDEDWSYKKDEDGNKILTFPGTGNLSYTGYPTCESDNTRYYVGCLNVKTGKMTVHDTEIFHMKPVFQEEKKPELVFDDKLTYSQQMDRLNAAFGSTKKKRAVNSRQKFSELYGEKYSAAMDAAMEHAVSDVKDTTDSPSNSTNRSLSHPSSSNFLPPCNPDVEHPHEVYTASQLISPQAMTALKSPAETFFKRTKEQLAEWISNQEYPLYILDQLEVMPVSEVQRWDKAKCLVYLSYMLKLFHYKPEDLKKYKCLPAEWPDAVQKELLDQFTVKSVADKGAKSVRYFPARLKDKLMMYILAMSLILEAAQLDPRLLIQDLAVPEKKVFHFYRALGCTVSSAKSSVKKVESGEPTVVLKLPLKQLTDTKPLGKRDSRKRNLRN